MIRVSVSPDLLRWARERAGLTQDDLAGRFKKLSSWESGGARPTLKQVEAFARAVHVPVGYLFLREPPDEPIPIPDFRTIAGKGVVRASPNLLDTIYACQERQSWYRDLVHTAGQPELDFIGSVALETRPEDAAVRMREALGFDLEARRASSTWEDAFRLFVRQVDEAGVLVMVSGIVGSNTRRKLDPDEFRGFALTDRLAPLVFINGADTKAAQMFTLAHELAHLWLGASALSDSSVATHGGHRPEEVWCNAVAAELLVPRSVLMDELRDSDPLPHTLIRLVRIFKVSRLVMLRRLLDTGWLDRAAFNEAWNQEVQHLRELARHSRDAGSGGDFYRTTISRVGRSFARALAVSTLEGQTLRRDAFRMLGISKTATFDRIARDVGEMS